MTSTSQTHALDLLRSDVGAWNSLRTNGISADTTLVDADLAKESAKLTALQTKQQLGVQALSIANQGSSILLSLFR